jgi:hypothetical protein
VPSERRDAMEFPTTLIEFQDRFPNEEACWGYLKRI